ncbi:MAG: T9SS type A sorting domain-containing protein [Bacteroidales bacterium]|jgi:hypothetical protein|nr:T9SS type A sorting domain-containing protein [Bacteroidales bacterium]
MRRFLSVILLLFSLAISLPGQQVTTYRWPTGEGEALLSDRYKVYLKNGSSPEEEIQVLMSNADYEGDWMANELMGRTFSFASLSSDFSSGPLSFRIVKLTGGPAETIEISPHSFNITSNLSAGGTEAEISVPIGKRYFSVNFTETQNQTLTRKWIKHMLCIFIDPPETNVPQKTDPGVVVYSDTQSAESLSTANIIYFPAGYHNLKNYLGTGIISPDGTIKLNNAQSIYLEGGAFVECIIDRQDYSNSDQRVYGRGIITGRQYLWYNNPAWDNTMIRYGQIINLGTNAVIEGVTILDSPSHGIVGRKANITNIKFSGWHSNNDGIRVGSGSVIKNCFIRAVDDHFYNFDIWVSDCVLWAGHNGSIMTYGWGGTGSPTYNAGSSLMENIDIINPEWIGLGNNNGLIMSQTGLDFKPYGYGGSTQTVIRNIRIEGSIPGITNLKPRTGSGGAIIAETVPMASIGYIGDLLLENITVNNQFSKGLIKGMADAASDGVKPFFIQNVRMKNVIIGGITVTRENAGEFFNIESSTVKELYFNDLLFGQTTSIEDNPIKTDSHYRIIPNPVTNSFSIMPAINQPHTIEIISLQGVTVYRSDGKAINDYTINPGDLRSGQYIVKIGIEGNKHFTIRMIHI